MRPRMNVQMMGWRKQMTVVEPIEPDHALAAELSEALGVGAFELLHQPVVDLEQQKVVGCEALLRWRLRSGRLVSPAVVMALSSDPEFLGEVTSWTIHQGAEDARKLFEDFGVQVSVNVSFGPDMPDHIDELVLMACDARDLPVRALAVEITELAFARTRGADLMLARLAALGVDVIIDDFAIGSGSLTRLREIGSCTLKTERDLVAEIAEVRRSWGKLEAVAQLARANGFNVVAKGVETRAQLAAARETGCTHAQGFRFGRPAPLKSVMRDLQSEAWRRGFDDRID